MSIQMLTLAWEYPAGPTVKLVLLAMANRADPEGGSIYPSIARLVADTGLGERTVQRTLRSLEQQGVISEVLPPGRRATRVYRLNVAELRAQVNRGDTAAPHKPSGVPPWHRGVPESPSGVPLTPSRGATVAPEPYLELSLNRQINGDDVAITPNAPPPWVADELAKFRAQRATSDGGEANQVAQDEPEGEPVSQTADAP